MQSHTHPAKGVFDIYAPTIYPRPRPDNNPPCKQANHPYPHGKDARFHDVTDAGFGGALS